MRAAVGFLLLAILQAGCATVRGGNTYLFGSWDAVSLEGIPIAHPQLSGRSAVFRMDGTFVLRSVDPEEEISETQTGQFLIGEEKVDGCFQLQMHPVEPSIPELSGTLCGEELTIVGRGTVTVLHRRR